MTTLIDGEYVYWDGEQAIETYDVHQAFHGLFVVDLDFQRPTMRYGRWRTEGEGWIHVALKDFPKDFQMALVLLGVT